MRPSARRRRRSASSVELRKNAATRGPFCARKTVSGPWPMYATSGVYAGSTLPVSNELSTTCHGAGGDAGLQAGLQAVEGALDLVELGVEAGGAGGEDDGEVGDVAG